MNKLLIYFSVGITIASVIFGIFMSLSKGPSEKKTSGPVPTPSALTGSTNETSGVKEFNIIGDDYTFNPSLIEVKKGDRVKITFRNVGNQPHNLTIEDLDITTKTVQTGQSDTIEFTASTAGEYIFYCSVGGHRALGMQGSLEVK
jgi:plastocyanin